MNKFFSVLLGVFVLGLLVVGCDKDYNNLGADIINDQHFTYAPTDINCVAYNQPTGFVQSNNLEVAPFGIFTHPWFGKTTAQFVGQLEMASTSISFFESTLAGHRPPNFKSVTLTIPYFSKVTAYNDDGSKSYELDSIYGDTNARMRLNVFENKTYIRTLDPANGLQQLQPYYNNDTFNHDNVLLNDSTAVAQNEQFFFDPAEQAITTTASDGTVSVNRQAPGMRLSLNKNFFYQKLVQAPDGKLANNNVFKDYFRGLFFQIDDTGNGQCMSMLNFKQAKIEILYYEDIENTDTDGHATLSRIQKTLTLNLTGNNVSLQSYTNVNSEYSAAMLNPNSSLGDPMLYLKGGQGSVSMIRLFGTTDVLTYDRTNDVLVSGSNGIPDELDTMKAEKWLINEANLICYVNNAAPYMGNPNIVEPNRLYLYDANNNRPIYDYYTDVSSAFLPKYNKYVYGGILEKGDNGRGYRYKFRLTNHLRNLINKDSTNIRLGLAVTESINNIGVGKISNSAVGPVPITKVPLMSVASPLGTIVFGSNIPSTDPNYDRRLRLQIYYTKPKQ